jgi:hypothetical protein
MATMLEERITEEQRSVVLSLLAKGLNAKDIHKEIIPVYGGKCLSRKAVHSWVEKFSEGRSKITDDETEMWKCLIRRSVFISTYCINHGNDVLGLPRAWQELAVFYKCSL